ncbi:MAG: hypothetical protein ACLTSZ_05330 [Lachnospiraceae bacterium]
MKGSNYLEALSQTKTVVFDKTGTMTEGVFEVTGVHHNGMEDQKLLGMRRWLRAHLHIRSVRVFRRPAESRWTDAEYQILRRSVAMVLPQRWTEPQLRSAIQS